MRRLLLVLLMTGLPQASAWSDTAKDRMTIEGTWLPVEAELGGQKFPDEHLKTIQLTMTKGTYTAKVGEVLDKGNYKLDPAAKPRAINITGTEGPNKGKTLLAIYELTGDSLRICYDLKGKKRPTEFKTAKNTQQFLVTYKRKKP